MIKNKPIFILLVDDDPAHSEVLRRALKASGMSVVIRQAGTLKEYREIAAVDRPDIAILDISLPDGRGVEVLASPPETGPFPIVIMTGQGDELLAAEAMKAGALDYFVKSPEAFARVPRTVERVLHEWGKLQERKRVEEALKESEEKYRSLTENINLGIYRNTVGPRGRFIEANPAIIRMFGYKSKEEFLAIKVSDLYQDPEDRIKFNDKMLREGLVRGEELRLKKKDGSLLTGLVSAVAVKDDQDHAKYYDGIIDDITEHKRAEELARAQHDTALALGGVLGLDEALWLCLETTIRISGMDCGGVYLVDNTSGALDLIFHKGLPPDFVSSALHFEADSPNAQIVMAGRPVYSEYQRLGVPEDEVRKPEGLRAIAILPVRHEDRVIACLNIASHILDEVPASVRPVLEAIAAQIGSAVARTQAEEALRKSEEKYRAIIETNQEWIWQMDNHGIHTYSNPAIERILGYSVGDIVGKEASNYMNPEDRRKIEGMLPGWIEKKTGWSNLIVRWLHKDGSIRWLESNAVPLLDAHGELTGFQGSDRDITERKQVEEALRLAEENYRRTLEDSPLGVCIVTADGETIYANRAILGIYGYDTIEELRATPIKNRYTPESYAEFKIRQQEREQGEESLSEYEISIVRKNGEVRHLQVSRKEALWNGEKQYQALYRDITERKKIEEALRGSEEKYRTLFDNAGEAIFVAQGGKLAFCNPMTTQLLGYTSEEIREKPFSDFLHPDDRDLVVERHLKRLKGEKLPGVYSFRVFDREGKMLWIDLRAVLINWEGQAATLNFASDVTERIRTEESLRESEEKYRTLYENASEAIFVLQDGKIVFSNPMTSRMVGYSKEELGTRPFSDFIHPDDRNMITERHMKRLRGEDMPAVYSHRILTKDGQTRWVDTSAVRINWDGKLATQIFANDITERKRAEESVQASLREKEVLLREIHHRVKNNMQVISSLFNLQAGVIKDKEALRILKEGQTRIRSMALVHEKLYQSGDLSKIDLAGYIQALSAHLFHVYLVDLNKVRLETDFEDVPLDINTAMPCALILNELISNALKHAFPSNRKGVLSIRLKRRKDGAVELRIADDGVGLPDGLDFQHTESLGLQIVNLLVGQLGGTIKAARTKGTVFTVTFHEMKRELIKNQKAA